MMSMQLWVLEMG